MRAIQKRPEPRTLTEYRLTVGATYRDYRDKNGLRASLCAEQAGICCYCMQRIRPEYNRMKIEHWRCRVDYPDEQLGYRNLLGACLGNEGQPRREQHCDSRKANLPLSRNPADPNHGIESLIRYLGDGRIESIDPAFTAELNDVLNLNHPTLVNRRKATLDGFMQSLAKKPLKKQAIQRIIAQWSDATGAELMEFCGIVMHWLQKKLARC